MPKYRKKPVVVEAVQWTGENFDEVISFAATAVWFDGLGAVWIDTLEGDMIAKIGDYIIKGVRGEFYPCKPDIIDDLTHHKFLQKYLVYMDKRRDYGRDGLEFGVLFNGRYYFVLSDMFSCCLAYRCGV